MQRITAPCVKCRPINTNREYIYVTGHCHADCYEALSFGYSMYVLAQPEKYDYAEGFMCSDGTFVDRYSAKAIAKNAGQLKSIYMDDEISALQSYMLM